ncbi:hypothetical protein UG55_10667 [Frankia sp. EI5c]|nr:hypothetical protein UG55_10667 [Frankia sp. EI5c]
MEGDDLGTWVVKFTGAGQGPKSLVAEVVVGELARGLGLAVPELVVIDVDPDLGRTEPDQEVQELLRSSAGSNLGMDYLPGSITYDPLAFEVEPGLAARVVWLDAFTLNVDRSWRNPNLLVWGGRLWLIDHGAALYPHHDWAGIDAAVERSVPGISDHVLLPVLGARAPELLAAADAELAPAVTAALLGGVVDLVPGEWTDAPGTAYVEWLLARVSGRRPWLEELLVPAAALGSERAGGGARGARRSERPDWLRGGRGA